MGLRECPPAEKEWTPVPPSVKNFLPDSRPKCVRIYAHKTTLPVEIRKEIRKVSPFRVNWVTSGEANATDKVMMQSARDAIHAHPNILIIVFITGDDHFHNLLSELRAGTRQTILICGRQTTTTAYSRILPTYSVPTIWSTTRETGGKCPQKTSSTPPKKSPVTILSKM